MMKQLLMILLLTPFISVGQIKWNKNSWLIDTTVRFSINRYEPTRYKLFHSNLIDRQDSLNKVCKERGHINPGYVETTLVYCPPRVEETDSTTVMIYPGCNSHSYTCQRCGERVTEGEKEVRIVLWRRQKIDSVKILKNKIDSLKQIIKK